MLIVSFGVMKSASSFQYQLLTELLQARHSSFASYLQHRKHLVGDQMSNLYFDPVEDEIEILSEKIPNSDYFAFKTHNVYSNNSLHDTGPVISSKLKENLDTDKIKIIGSIRDPRSIVLSAIDHSKRNAKQGITDFFTSMNSIEPLIPHIKEGFRKAYYWNLTGRTSWIPYQLLFNYELEIVFLLQNVTGLYSVDLAARLIELKKTNQIHQFNKGLSNRWETELDDETKKQLGEVFSEEISFYDEITKESKTKLNNYRNYLIKTKGQKYIDSTTLSLREAWK